MQMDPNSCFPFDVCRTYGLPGDIGALIDRLEPVSMRPPHPWGQWLYAQVFEQQCAKLPGDIVELGVGRGGMSLFLGHIARKLPKKVFSLDSFEGMPTPGPENNPYFRRGDYGTQLDVDLLHRFERRIADNGLQTVVIPKKGFFEDTAADFSDDQKFCFVHLDSDLYRSITVSLEATYDRTTDGGIIVVDDYFHPVQGPARALAHFFTRRGIAPRLHVSFPYSVFFTKGDNVMGDAKYARAFDGCVYSLDWLRRDSTFREALEMSLSNSRGPRRAHENCALLLTVIQSTEAREDIYYYWKAMEDFWVASGFWNDFRPSIDLARPRPFPRPSVVQLTAEDRLRGDQDCPLTWQLSGDSIEVIVNRQPVSFTNHPGTLAILESVRAGEEIVVGDIIAKYSGTAAVGSRQVELSRDDILTLLVILVRLRALEEIKPR